MSNTEESEELYLASSNDSVIVSNNRQHARELENVTEEELSDSTNEYFSSDDLAEDIDNKDQKNISVVLETTLESDEEEDIPGPSGLKLGYTDDVEMDNDSDDDGNSSDVNKVNESDYEDEKEASLEDNSDDGAEVVYYEEDSEANADEVDEQNKSTTEEESDEFDGDDEYEKNNEEETEDEYLDLEEEENFTFDSNYHPNRIPPLIESGEPKSFMPSIMELRAAIDEEGNFPFVSLDDFQLDLEDYMRSNLYKQLSLVDEISKLLTNTTAEIELQDLHPSAYVEPPTEDIPVDFKPTAVIKARCGQKTQKFSYLWELWWAWVESVMPVINNEFLKNFKQTLIDKMRPKNANEYFINEPINGIKPSKAENPLEINDFSVKLYELQLVEDDELNSDYEPDVNAPIYYKMPSYNPDGTEDTAEYPEIIIQDDGAVYVDESDDGEQSKKRKKSINETQSLAKRRKLELSNNSVDSVNDSLPPPLLLNRRRSSQSFRSSASPPLLTPQLTPRTPIKNLETPLTNKEDASVSSRSDNDISPTIEEEKSDRAKARAERKKHKEKRKERRKEKSKNKKLGRESIDEGSSQNKREEFCDSESVLSISDVEVDLSLTDDEIKSFNTDGSFFNLRKRLAELKKEAQLAEEFEILGEGGVSEQYAEELTHQKVDLASDDVTKISGKYKIIAPSSDIETEVPPTPVRKASYKVIVPGTDDEVEDSEPELYSTNVEPTISNNKEAEDLSTYRLTTGRSKLEFQGVEIDGEELEKLACANILDIGQKGEIIDLTESDQLLPGCILGELNSKFNNDELDDLSGELLKMQKDLALSMFQMQKKSKMLFDFLSEHVERQSLLDIIEDAEEKLFDNLEGLSESANLPEMKEAYQILSTYYKEQGVIHEEPDEDTLDLMAIKHLEIADRTF